MFSGLSGYSALSAYEQRASSLSALSRYSGRPVSGKRYYVASDFSLSALSVFRVCRCLDSTIPSLPRSPRRLVLWCVRSSLRGAGEGAGRLAIEPIGRDRPRSQVGGCSSVLRVGAVVPFSFPAPIVGARALPWRRRCLRLGRVPLAFGQWRSFAARASFRRIGARRWRSLPRSYQAGARRGRRLRACCGVLLFGAVAGAGRRVLGVWPCCESSRGGAGHALKLRVFVLASLLSACFRRQVRLVVSLLPVFVFLTPADGL